MNGQAAGAEANVFEAREISYRYEDALALDRLSLEVRAGERLALLGANGSGKSTLLRILAGLAFPQSGQVLFRGQALTEKGFGNGAFAFDFRRRVGLLFQNSDVQLFSPTVFDELAFGPLQMRLPADEIRRGVDAMLRLLDIEDLRDRAPHRLSGGEKKRVALASIMILDSEVLLLDEPTAALDPKSQSQIVDLLISWRGGRKTVVIATHDLDSLEEIADRCVVFENGKIAAEGPPLEILHNVPLLTRSRLLHAHRHSHGEGTRPPHPHIHES